MRHARAIIPAHASSLLATLSFPIASFRFSPMSFHPFFSSFLVFPFLLSFFPSFLLLLLLLRSRLLLSLPLPAVHREGAHEPTSPSIPRSPDPSSSPMPLADEKAPTNHPAYSPSASPAHRRALRTRAGGGRIPLPVSRLTNCLRKIPASRFISYAGRPPPPLHFRPQLNPR